MDFTYKFTRFLSFLIGKHSDVYCWRVLVSTSRSTGEYSLGLSVALCCKQGCWLDGRYRPWITDYFTPIPGLGSDGRVRMSGKLPSNLPERLIAWNGLSDWLEAAMSADGKRLKYGYFSLVERAATGITYVDTFRVTMELTVRSR
jgi:hypothetical protein